MSIQTQIGDLVRAKLAGREIDIEGFVDELLATTTEAGPMRCSLASERALRFEVRDEAFEVELDACRGKLRMLCARLSVLCNEQPDATVSPYGGEGIIRLAPPNGKGPHQWTARFTNTPDAQEFMIIPAGVENPQIAGVVKRFGEQENSARR
jgi:hypothetical protein